MNKYKLSHLLVVLNFLSDAIDDDPKLAEKYDKEYIDISVTELLEVLE